MIAVNKDGRSTGSILQHKGPVITKAAVHGLDSEPITAYVGHIRWQLSVSTLHAASADSVVGLKLTNHSNRCSQSYYKELSPPPNERGTRGSNPGTQIF